jgi:hypothetical protein
MGTVTHSLKKHFHPITSQHRPLARESELRPITPEATVSENTRSVHSPRQGQNWWPFCFHLSNMRPLLPGLLQVIHLKKAEDRQLGVDKFIDSVCSGRPVSH